MSSNSKCIKGGVVGGGVHLPYVSTSQPNQTKQGKQIKRNRGQPNCHLGGHGKVEEEVSSTIAQRQ